MSEQNQTDALHYQKSNEATTVMKRLLDRNLLTIRVHKYEREKKIKFPCSW